jgi:putative Mg2+ transporter-C (MgtC) family protein
MCGHTIIMSYGLLMRREAGRMSNVLGTEVVLDPSRIAAQIGSGIGFLGAGVIFVRSTRPAR